jgi:hypothetical protein
MWFIVNIDGHMSMIGLEWKGALFCRGWFFGWLVGLLVGL